MRLHGNARTCLHSRRFSLAIAGLRRVGRHLLCSRMATDAVMTSPRTWRSGQSGGSMQTSSSSSASSHAPQPCVRRAYRVVSVNGV